MSRRSGVNPNYKRRYRVTKTSEYDRALIQCGSVAVWISAEAIKDWDARPTRRRGGQAKFSDLAIETVLTLGLVFHLPLRQTEGLVSLTTLTSSAHLPNLQACKVRLNPNCSSD